MPLGASDQHAETSPRTGVHRLNWGCGGKSRRGWINSDRTAGSGVDLVADIREGLPLESGTVHYTVGIHALQELTYPELGPALEELFRVLRPGGTLRLAVPDLDAAIRGYTRGEDDRFLVARDRVRSRGGRFIAHLLDFGHARMLFTLDFLEELLVDAGFVDVTACRPGETASEFRDIVELDSYEDSGIFVEATRPPGRHPFLEVVEAAPVRQDQQELAGCSVATPQRGLRSHDGSLEIVGWVVGRESRASEIEVVVDGAVIGRAPVNLPRPDVGRRFGQYPGSLSAGFRIVLTAEGEGVSEVVLNAALEGGSAVPFWTIGVDASRTPPVDYDRSPTSTPD
jgi:hypothetical protein